MIIEIDKEAEDEAMEIVKEAMARCNVFRKDHKLTYDKFARAIGCGVPSVEHWLTGSGVPSLLKFIRILRACGMDMIIVDEDGDPIELFEDPNEAEVESEVLFES